MTELTERQARIAAGTHAVRELFAQHKEKPEGERGRNIPAVVFAEAVLQASDAVGRVSEAEAERLMAEYADTVRDHYRATVDGIGRGELAGPDHAAITDQYRRQRAHIIALLTAVVAERGHDETGGVE